MVYILLTTWTARTRSKVEGYCYRLKIPKTENSKIDQRRFTNYAPTAWNSLPWEIRSLRNVDIFKGRLKHYLYDRIWLVLLFIASWFVDGCIFIFGALCINISLHLSLIPLWYFWSVSDGLLLFVVCFIYRKILLWLLYDIIIVFFSVKICFWNDLVVRK